jgi:hypothetical protein
MLLTMLEMARLVSICWEILKEAFLPEATVEASQMIAIKVIYKADHF